MAADSSVYNECIKGCDLEGIFADRLFVEVFDRTAPTRSAEVQMTVNSSASLTDESTVEAMLEAKLDGYVKAKAKTPAWTIEAKVIAVFTISEELQLSEDDLNLFASKQGVLTLMPYLRSSVSGLATDSSLGPVTMPLIKFFPSLSQVEAVEDTE